MAGGHKVETAELDQAARTVADVPRQAIEQPLASVEDVQLTARDFGRAHGTHFNAYSTGVERLAACAQSYLTASEELAGKFGEAGRRYQANEDESRQSFQGTE